LSRCGQSRVGRRRNAAGVLLRGGGWPTPTSRCPIHEAQSPAAGERVTLTLRHNKGGYGADYFPNREELF